MDARELRRAGGSSGSETDSSTHVAGALSCAVGNFLISLSLNLQRRAHRDNTAGVHYTKLKGWWVGIVCMFVGEIGNFLAYGMAPAALVSPLGAITVISNAVLSRVILNEPMPRQKAVGVVLALVGAVLIAVNAPSPYPLDTGGKELKEEEEFYESIMTVRAAIYICLVAVVAFVVSNPLKLSFLVSDKLRQEMVVVPCVLCGCAGTMTVTSAKAVFNSLSQAFAGNPAMFARGDICWLTYLIIIVAVGSIIGQVKYLNEALMNHGASRVVPVYYITFTIITMSAGMTLFMELKFEPMAVSIALFVLGLMFAFSGVWLINSLQPEEGEGGPKVSPTKKVAGERDGCEDGQEETEREQGQDHVGKSVKELASGIFLACARALPLSLCASRRVRVRGACACPWFCMSHLCVSYRDRTIPGGHASASTGQSHCQESSTIDSAGRGRRRIDDCHEKKDQHQRAQSPAWW